MHGQQIRRIDRQLIGEEDTFLWLSRGDLKVETGSEIIADQALQIKCHATKILKTETAIMNYVNNLTREENTLYQHAQCWQKSHT